jgi:hypothetical protein
LASASWAKELPKRDAEHRKPAAQASAEAEVTSVGAPEVFKACRLYSILNAAGN